MNDLPIYLIWSNEHKAWWGPNGCGYVRSLTEAGRYTRDEAIWICKRAIPGDAAALGMLPELPVRALDAAAVVIDQPHTPAELV